MFLVVPFVDGLSLACTAMIQMPTGQEETDTRIIRPHDKRSLRLICSERETTFPNRETQHTHHFVLRQYPISTINQSAKRKLRVVSGLDKVSIDQGTEEIRKSGESRRLYCIPLSALYSKTCPKSRRQRSRTRRSCRQTGSSCHQIDQHPGRHRK